MAYTYTVTALVFWAIGKTRRHPEGEVVGTPATAPPDH